GKKITAPKLERHLYIQDYASRPPIKLLEWEVWAKK
ncbi:MAG: hypothetical protein ACI9IP_002779, partial [Arcticibacterium sp.]